MASFDLTDTLKALQGERARAHKELTKLDKAIAVLRQLAGTAVTTNGQPGKRTVSVAARRKMAKAQKLRWAKLRAERKAKA
jgi:mRNA-degrading endonuclease RelE of RelBE toxin-antitoxin system